MAPRKSPSFHIHAVDFYLGTKALSLKEVGQLITDACNAALDGRREFFDDGVPFFTQPVFFRWRGFYISPAVRREVYAKAGWQCLHCGSTERLSIDHIIARANGGGDEIENLQALCMPCNRRKGTN